MRRREGGSGTRRRGREGGSGMRRRREGGWEWHEEEEGGRMYRWWKREVGRSGMRKGKGRGTGS